MGDIKVLFQYFSVAEKIIRFRGFGRASVPHGWMQTCKDRQQTAEASYAKTVGLARTPRCCYGYSELAALYSEFCTASEEGEATMKDSFIFFAELVRRWIFRTAYRNPQTCQP